MVEVLFVRTINSSSVIVEYLGILYKVPEAAISPTNKSGYVSIHITHLTEERVVKN